MSFVSAQRFSVLYGRFWGSCGVCAANEDARLLIRAAHTTSAVAAMYIRSTVPFTSQFENQAVFALATPSPGAKRNMPSGGKTMPRSFLTT